MKFESEEPPHGALSPLGYAFEDLVHLYPLVLAHSKWCAVDKTNAGAFP